MPAKLYVVHGSHPCVAVEEALKLKGVPYKRVELLPPSHFAIQKLRFGAPTVPAIRFADGEKVSGPRRSCAASTRWCPSPGWCRTTGACSRPSGGGEADFQPVARRLLWKGFALAPRAMASYQEGSSLPTLPAPVLLAFAPVATRVEARINAISDEAVRADLRELPRSLERIDALLEDGVIGGDPPNAADLQIATTLRLIMTVADVRPLIDAHRAGAYAREMFPSHQGELPAGTFPAAWLPAVPAVT